MKPISRSAPKDDFIKNIFSQIKQLRGITQWALVTLGYTLNHH